MKIIQIVVSPGGVTNDGQSWPDVIYGLSDDGALYSFDKSFRAKKEWTLCIPKDESEIETIKSN